jgi:O-antigen/teichoic acid export membrane protein
MIARAARMARASTGVRASGYLLLGTVANIGGSYAYNLLCIRWLGPSGYGDVAALTALATMLTLPLLGVQAAIAREVATFRADRNEHKIDALLHLTARRAFLLSAIALALFLVLSPLLQELLNIGSFGSVVSAACLTIAAAQLPVFQGFLQGTERFARISASLVTYGLGRTLLAIPLMLAGLGVAGAVAGGTIAAVLAGAVTLLGLAATLRRHIDGHVALELEAFKPVIFGLFAFTVLMNADVLVAKAFLSQDEAGTYASASLVGKLAALLPAGAIAPVLLPRATARLRRGEDAAPIVTASLAAAASFGVFLTLIGLVVPQDLVAWAFGEAFADATDLIAPCAAAMTLCGIINVNLTFAVALRDDALIRLLGAAVVAQLVLFTFLHDSPYEILAATSIAAMLVIVLHELRSPVAIWRLLRAR